MFEKYMILTRGFKNVSQGGQVTGFQLKVRITAYRGLYLSCIEDFEITVDGETYARDTIAFSSGTSTYSLDQLSKVTDVRWPFGEPATLAISKPGGLKAGMHDVRVVQKLRISYLPAPAQVFTSRKRMTLVM